MDKPLGSMYTVKEEKKESTSTDLIFYFNLAREAKEKNYVKNVSEKRRRKESIWQILRVFKSLQGV